MSIFDKWNKKVNDDFLKELDAQESGQGGTFEKVPYDKYEVAVKKMELKESKNGDPMVQIVFRILTGSYKGKTIMMNQLIPDTYRIHLCNDFLRSLDSGVDIRFKDYGQYSELVLDVAEAIDKAKLEYALEFDENEKGYDKFRITDVFETE